MMLARIIRNFLGQLLKIDMAEFAAHIWVYNKDFGLSFMNPFVLSYSHVGYYRHLRAIA